MSKVGHAYFGKSAVSVVGRSAWDTQDASRTWSDEGAVRKAADRFVTDVERVVSENATQAVSDYVGASMASVRATPQGDVVLGLRIENQEAAMIVEVPLRKLIMAALEELRPILGANAEAQATLSAIITFGRQLASLGPKPASAPSQHQGASQHADH